MSTASLFDFEKLISQRFEAKLDPHYEDKKDLGRSIVADMLGDTDEAGIDRIQRIGARLKAAKESGADALEIAAIEVVLKNCQARAARRKV